MREISLLIICATFALSTAKPWYTDNYSGRAHQERYFPPDSEGRYDDAAKGMSPYNQFAFTQKAGLVQCQSAALERDGITTYVHVCEAGKDSDGNKQNCFVTDGACCISASSGQTPVEQFLLSVGQESVTVSFYESGGSKGVCYVFDENHKKLAPCSGCRPGFCEPSICVENTQTQSLDSCDDTGCRCKEGFAPPYCCDCDLEGLSGRIHYRAPDGTCKPLCRDFCASAPTVQGCSRCQEGYKTPDCCECEEGYYRDPVDNTCKPLCEKFCASVPTNTGCSICKEGFQAPDCCKCKDGYYRDGDNCEPICEKFCASVPTDRGCSTCKEGFEAPDCCKCKQGYYRDGDNCKPICEKFCASVPTDTGCSICKEGFEAPDCCKCKDGYYRVGDNCEPVCEKFCASARTVEGCSTCKEGFEAPDCCKCKQGYYRVGDNCEPICGEFCASVPTDTGCSTCKEGFEAPDCCKCKQGYYRVGDNCEPICEKFCASATTVEGCSTCKEGFEAPDCCKCKDGYYRVGDNCEPICEKFCASVPTDTGCSICKEGFEAPDCCKCKQGYYRVGDTCKPICEKFCASVPTDTGCSTCKEGFKAPDCCKCRQGYYRDGDTCKQLCSPDRDIYFLIDTTSSNNRKQFCQLEYGVEQVIAALDPGSDMSGTRIGAIFYPRRIRVSGRYELSSSVFFKLGSSCSEVMPKYHAMIDSFYHRPDPYIDGKTNPYDEYVQIIGTFPAVAIRKVTDQIQQSIDSGESSTRRRLIVVITDGNNQGTSEELIRDVTALTKVSTGVTIVAVGNSRYFIDRSNQEKQEFNASLNLIADGNSSNVLISEDSTEVAIQLVQKMVQLGVLCENQATPIIARLEKEQINSPYCDCVDARGTTEDRIRDLCKESCPGGETQEELCRTPPQCASSQLASSSLQAGLEEDILAAVEEVLQRRLEG